MNDRDLTNDQLVKRHLDRQPVESKIDSTFKDPKSGLWLVCFTDFNGDKQETIDASLTKAVQLAMVNRTKCINL
jgi:hypothetical protein